MGFASTASAQVTPPFTCSAEAVPPTVRAEGLTELVGDIVLRCTGGTEIPDGGVVPVANFQVFLGNTTVTSRILGNVTNNASEALLLVDEPTDNELLSQANPLFGCPGAAGATCTAPGPRVYQGLVTGNSLTFIGVPVNPPATNQTRVYRITNVRANASVIGGGVAGTPGQIQAFISITGPTSIPVNNPVQIVGFVQPGLSTTSTAVRGIRQCVSVARTAPGVTLSFTENFATAFKVRVIGDPPSQVTPGTIFNTESGLTIPVGGQTAGLADFGTRLRASFANIPDGLNVWVSVRNVNNTIINGTAITAAQLTAVSDAASTGAFSPISGDSNGLAQVPLTGGAGVAIWEVTAASELALETLEFAVRFAATSDPGNNIPAIGTGTVSMSYAPVPPAFNLGPGSSASSTLPIPRFVDTGVARNLVVVNACRTNLLFPFVTNQAGFDTGLAIANTSQDPFGTTPQSGVCTWNYFGANAPDPIDTAPVAGGTVTVALASTDAPNFQGYVIAVCNFEFAHGFAFVSDVGARNLAMGYLALVMPETSGVPRQGLPLNPNTFGEVLGQ